MQEEIKTKWVAALRSGEYNQGVRALRYRDGGEDWYCCLGVLCELAVAEGVIPDPAPSPWPSPVDDGNSYCYAGSIVYLPDEVRVWAGLEVSNPRLGHSNLAELNDTGSTFADIARVIEENF